MLQKLETRLEGFRKERFTQRKHHEDTLMDIATAYNQNRTQILQVMDEMQHSVSHLKIGLKDRNSKQQNYMTQLRRDIDDVLCDLMTNEDTEKRGTKDFSRNHFGSEMPDSERNRGIYSTY